MKERGENPGDKNNNNNILARLIKQLMELLLAMPGIKAGNDDAANQIRNQQNMGDHLENNSKNLDMLNTLLAVPGVGSIAASFAKGAMKSYLNNDGVQGALQSQLDGPQGDKIRNELAKYPNICGLMNDVAQNTKSAGVAQNATQHVAPQPNHLLVRHRKLLNTICPPLRILLLNQVLPWIHYQTYPRQRKRKAMWKQRQK